MNKKNSKLESITKTKKIPNTVSKVKTNSNTIKKNKAKANLNAKINTNKIEKVNTFAKAVSNKNKNKNTNLKSKAKHKTNKSTTNKTNQSIYFLTVLIKKNKEHLKDVLQDIEKNTNKKGLAEILEIILGELINNCIISNLRRLFFHSCNYKFDNEKEYEKGVIEFKKNFSQLNFNLYQRALELLDLKVTININKNIERIIVFIQNNNTMSKVEEKIIRKNLSLIMKNLPENVYDLYLNFGKDDSEFGIGMNLVISLIRELGFDPQYLRIFNRKNQIITRLELPLSFDYVTLRDQPGCNDII